MSDDPKSNAETAAAEAIETASQKAAEKAHAEGKAEAEAKSIEQRLTALETRTTTPDDASILEKFSATVTSALEPITSRLDALEARPEPDPEPDPEPEPEPEPDPFASQLEDMGKDVGGVIEEAPKVAHSLFRKLRLFGRE